MAKYKWTILSLVAGVMFLSVLLQIVVSVKLDALSARQPLTLPELNELIKQVEQHAKQDNTGSSTALPVASAVNANDNPVSLSTRLERAPSREMYIKSRGNVGGRIENAFKTKVCEICYAASAVVSESESGGWARELAQERMKAGDWEGARRCYEESIRTTANPYMHRFACAHLAWLVDDPELAARYLDLSCQEDEDMWFDNAITLCKATGSETLASHYQSRLDNVKKASKNK